MILNFPIVFQKEEEEEVQVQVRQLDGNCYPRRTHSVNGDEHSKRIEQEEEEGREGRTGREGIGRN